MMALAATATQVSQYGITWTFSQARPVGQFANGDWWVVGPVTVTSVTPAPTIGRNGSMVNPAVGVQGFDSLGGAYSAVTRATFPLTLNPIQSLISTISNPAATNCLRYGTEPGWSNYRGECMVTGSMQTQAVLTCVADTLAAGNFRPPYAGGAFKPLHSAAAIQWARLPLLTPPAAAPNKTGVIRNFKRVWIDHYNSWIIEHTFAIDNRYGYGREVGNIVSEGAQYVMLNTTVRETLAVRLIQLGIDNYGVLRAGGKWQADGGHHNGRKWPILFAGLMLDDADMKNVGHDYSGAVTFGEDGHTYYGQDSVVLWGKVCSGEGTYFENGCTGNGSKDCRDPAGLVDGCAAYRTCCTSHTWVGEMLAALMMGAKGLWNHNAFFDYVDRWIAGGGGYGGRDAGIEGAFIRDMWDTYRSQVPFTGIKALGPRPAVNKAIAVYPQPMTGSLYFENRQATTSAVQLAIYDHAGKMVYHRTIRDQGPVCFWWSGVDVQGQTALPGVFFYTVKIDGQKFDGSFVKAK
jgi:hypothetical protein